jgi:hypothetical protein
VADEPSNAELAWRLQRIQETLNGVVGRPEYDADKRSTDYRFSDLAHDLAEERRERTEAVKAIRELVEAQAKNAGESRMHWRSLILTGVLPALVALAGVIVTIALSHGGLG